MVETHHAVHAGLAHHQHALLKAGAAKDVAREQILLQDFDPVRPAAAHSVPGHKGLKTRVGESGFYFFFGARPNDECNPRNHMTTCRGQPTGGGFEDRASATKSPWDL